MTALMRAVTHAGGSLPSIAIVAVVLLAAHRPIRAGRAAMARDALLLLAPLVAGVTADALKEVVRRPRPPGRALIEASGWGFPSSHAARSAATAVVVIGVLTAYQHSLVRRRAVAALAVLFAGLVGWSRVYLHVHYLSDIVAGWLVGIAVAGVVLSARRWAIRRAHRDAMSDQPGPGMTDQSEAPDAIR
ncbi:MAG: phosphatase PAP2 family protein [Mycobacteriales bacterium]